MFPPASDGEPSTCQLEAANGKRKREGMFPGQESRALLRCHSNVRFVLNIRKHWSARTHLIGFNVAVFASSHCENEPGRVRRGFGLAKIRRARSQGSTLNDQNARTLRNHPMTSSPEEVEESLWRFRPVDPLRGIIKKAVRLA